MVKGGGAANPKLDQGRLCGSLQSTGGKLLKSKKSLSMLIDMPIDILLEIFKLLSPNDLVNLSNTSLMFRRNLSDRKFASVWKITREKEGAPECPSHVSERSWAILLFSSQCTHCGSSRVRNADFYIRQRLCKVCRDRELVTECGLRRSVDRAVFDLIPFTMFNGQRALKEKHYYFCDIMDMQEKLAHVQAGAKTSDSSTKLQYNLEQFKSEQRKILADNTAAQESLIEWQANKNEQLRQKSEDAFDMRYNEIQRRFKVLGYSEDECTDLGSEFEMHKLVRQKSQLTEKTWKRIQEIFQPILDATRQRAIDTEIKKLRASRRDIVEQLYASYKLGVSPRLWKHYPSVYNICKLGPFVSLIEADADVSVNIADFKTCMGELPRLIADAFEDTKSRLRQSVLEARHPIHKGICSTHNFQELELATMVFRCGSCRQFVVGFGSGVKAHNCSPTVGLSRGSVNKELPLHEDFPHRFEFSMHGASVAVQVLEAAGLDPRLATTSQLEEKDCAFRCLECLRQHRDKYAFSWVGMIAHATYLHSQLIQGATYPGCDLLPPEYMFEYKQAVKQGLGCRRWTCTRCTLHMAGRYSDVIRHLKRHGIDKAEDGIDIIMMDQPRVIFRYN